MKRLVIYVSPELYQLIQRTIDQGKTPNCLGDAFSLLFCSGLFPKGSIRVCPNPVLTSKTILAELEIDREFPF